jgi:hypothetical protein
MSMGPRKAGLAWRRSDDRESRPAWLHDCGSPGGNLELHVSWARVFVSLAGARRIKEGTALDLAIAMAVTCSPTAPSFAAQTGWRCQVPSWTWMSSSATRPCASR